MKFLPFEEAKEIVRKRGLKNQPQWRNYCKSREKPTTVPSNPEQHYKNNGWIDWGDWFGTGTRASQDTGWSIEKVKELLRSMIETKVLYEWPEGRLYPFLLTKGVLNLDFKNRHSNFFKNLIKTAKTDEGKRIIEEYAYSENKDTPILSNISLENYDEKIPIASTEELVDLVNDKADPLDYKEPPTVDQILSSTALLESINVDEEVMQFFLEHL